MMMILRRMHLLFGLLGVLAFLLTGQVMGHHLPAMVSLLPDLRMMYISRHIYLLGGSLVNLAFGLYLQVRPVGWRRNLQWIGSLLVLFSPLLLLLAFMAEPEHGMAGRGWRSLLGLFAVFLGVTLHFISSLFSVKNAELN